MRDEYNGKIQSGTNRYGPSSGQFNIGTYDNGGDFREIAGYVDEYRISNTERYTSTFTPSTTAFTSDANTMFHRGNNCVFRIKC